MREVKKKHWTKRYFFSKWIRSFFITDIEIKTEPYYLGELPSYKTALSSGMDLMAQIQEPLTLRPGDRAAIDTGISISIPSNLEGQVRPRSGLSLKQGLTVLNAPGTIDADYTGVIRAILINSGKNNVVIEPLDRIAQLIISPVKRIRWELVYELEKTKRGSRGFGSTGI